MLPILSFCGASALYLGAPAFWCGAAAFLLWQPIPPAVWCPCPLVLLPQPSCLMPLPSCCNLPDLPTILWPTAGSSGSLLSKGGSLFVARSRLLCVRGITMHFCCSLMPVPSAARSLFQLQLVHRLWASTNNVTIPSFYYVHVNSDINCVKVCQSCHRFIPQVNAR